EDGAEDTGAGPARDAGAERAHARVVQRAEADRGERAARRAGIAHDGDAPEGAPVPAEEAVRPARDGPAECDRPRARHADHAETREGAARWRERARARHLAEAPVGVGHEDARRAVVEHGGEREPAPAAERDVAAEASEAAPARRRLPDLGDRPDAPPAALGDRGPAADEEGPEGEAIAAAERGSVDARDRPPEHDVARADQMREGLAPAGEDRGARADEGRPAAVVERDLGEARERKAERRAV